MQGDRGREVCLTLYALKKAPNSKHMSSLFQALELIITTIVIITVIIIVIMSHKDHLEAICNR